LAEAIAVGISLLRTVMPGHRRKSGVGTAIAGIGGAAVIVAFAFLLLPAIFPASRVSLSPIVADRLLKPGIFE